MESCDPGADAELGSDSSEKALKLAAVRSYFGIGLLSAGAPTEVARCIAGRSVEEFPLSALTGRPDPGEAPAFRRRIQSLAKECARQ